MKNQFYRNFDCNRKEPIRANIKEIRTPFQIDRDRIVFSYAFRRLQSKTQVFQSGEFDFYRNRLTHSIEVAKIARSITDYLNHQSDELDDSFFINSDLVEAVGLAHDLGHPPFGHIGERKLNELMEPYGGFEGNAQTLRILTRLFYNREDGSKGMNPNRALVDGILKYKCLFSHSVKITDSGDTLYPENHFLYDDDDMWLHFAMGGQTHNLEAFCQSRNISLNSFKSLECQIMDWADDTAYSINDIIDSIQAGYLTPHKIEKWAQDSNLSDQEKPYLEELLKVIANSHYEAFLNKQIGSFIHAVTLVKRENPMTDLTNRYRYGIKVDSDSMTKAELYKRIAVDLIFQSPQIHRIEYKGALILKKLFDALVDNYIEKPSNKHLKLIPRRFSSQLEQSSNQTQSMRIICDSLSEMTDALAIRTYKQLFDPDFGSILDIV